MWVGAVLVIIIFSGLCNAGMRKKKEKVFHKWTEGTVWYNRAFMFFDCYLFVVAKAYFVAFGVGSIVQYVGAFIKLVQSFENLIFAISEN